jgi:hypothetical protein
MTTKYTAPQYGAQTPQSSLDQQSQQRRTGITGTLPTIMARGMPAPGWRRASPSEQQRPARILTATARITTATGSAAIIPVRPAIEHGKPHHVTDEDDPNVCDA